MPAREFKHRPTVVEALQWDGSNYDEAMRFLGGTPKNVLTGPDKSLWLHEPESRTVVPFEGWIIKDSDGYFDFLSKESFEKKYIPSASSEFPEVPSDLIVALRDDFLLYGNGYIRYTEDHWERVNPQKVILRNFPLD